jgi:hypothetical protein
MNNRQDTGKWTLGLGQFTALANMTAVAVVLIMFYEAQQRFYEQSAADRQMFREELRLMHQDSQHQWDAIRENQKATSDLAAAVRDLAEEVRRRPGKP